MSDSPSMCSPRVAMSSTATASTPASALPVPNALDAAHSTAAASAPSAMPTTGSAVSTPRPTAAVRPAGVGRMVPNAKAPVTERITQ